MKNFKDEETEKKFLGETEESTEKVEYVPTFKEKVANFFYHYKWHTIVALFLVVAITITSVQMCKRDKYDMYIMYAGSKEITRVSKDGDIPLFNKIASSLTRVSGDYDENGEVLVSFSNLFAMTDEEIREVQKQPGKEVNISLLQSDKKVLQDRMMYSEYYVCMFSPGVFDQLNNTDIGSMFVPVKPYLPQGEKADQIELYTDSAVKLSSTDFYKLPGISELPPDTVVCLRVKPAVNSHFNNSKTEKLYSQSEEVFRNIIAYEIKE